MKKKQPLEDIIYINMAISKEVINYLVNRLISISKLTSEYTEKK